MEYLDCMVRVGGTHGRCYKDSPLEQAKVAVANIAGPIYSRYTCAPAALSLRAESCILLQRLALYYRKYIFRRCLKGYALFSR